MNARRADEESSAKGVVVVSAGEAGAAGAAAALPPPLRTCAMAPKGDSERSIRPLGVARRGASEGKERGGRGGTACARSLVLSLRGRVQQAMSLSLVVVVLSSFRATVSARVWRASVFAVARGVLFVLLFCVCLFREKERSWFLGGEEGCALSSSLSPPRAPLCGNNPAPARSRADPIRE